MFPFIQTLNHSVCFVSVLLGYIFLWYNFDFLKWPSLAERFSISSHNALLTNVLMSINCDNAFPVSDNYMS